jgi:hypothetical protein
MYIKSYHTNRCFKVHGIRKGDVVAVLVTASSVSSSMSFLLGTTAGALVAGGVRAMDEKHTLVQTALSLGVLWLLQSRPLANGAAPGRVCTDQIYYCF